MIGFKEFFSVSFSKLSLFFLTAFLIVLPSLHASQELKEDEGLINNAVIKFLGPSPERRILNEINSIKDEKKTLLCLRSWENYQKVFWNYEKVTVHCKKSNPESKLLCRHCERIDILNNRLVFLEGEWDKMIVNRAKDAKDIFLELGNKALNLGDKALVVAREFANTNHNIKIDLNHGFNVLGRSFIPIRQSSVQILNNNDHQAEEEKKDN